MNIFLSLSRDRGTLKTTKKISRFLYTTLFFLLFCLYSNLSLPSKVHAKDIHPTKILILNSYHKGFFWVDGIVDAVESGLTAEHVDYDLSVEYMDTKANKYTAAYKKILYDLYSFKYKNSTFDAIICSDDHAFDFLREFHEKLFPDTPIIFCAVNNTNAAQLIDHTCFTGVLETPDQESMINLALKLHPGLKKIFLIADTTPSANYYWDTQVVPLMERFPDIEFTRIDDTFSFPEIETTLRTLPDDAIALYAVLTRDTTGRYLPLQEVVTRIGKASRRPVYTFLSQDMNYGLTGGNVQDGYRQGEIAVQMLLRVLRGENIADIPVEKKSTSKFMFNYPQLRRYNIKLSDLPEESIILKKPISFFGKNKKMALIVMGIIISLSLLIVLLAFIIVYRRRTEGKRLANEKHLRLLFENSPIGICTVDSLGNFVTTNPAYEQMLGYSKKELSTMSFFDITQPEFRPKNKKLFQDMFSLELTGYKLEKKYICKNGTTILVSVNANAVADETGKTHVGTAFVEDITERSQAQTLLMQSKQLIDSVINGIAEPISVKDEKHAWIFLNDAFCEMLGHNREELIGKSDYDFFPAHEADIFWKQDNAVMHSEKPNVIEENRTIAKRTHIFSTSKASFINPITGKKNIVGIIRDITHVKETEQQLQQAQKMESVGRLAGGVAHDYNNMLSIIIGYSESILMNMRPEEPLFDKITAILDAGQRSADITRQLLAFSRQQTTAPKVLDFNDSIEGMLKMLRRLIGENINLSWRPGAKVWQVKIDPSQIDQMLANLCVNSRDAIASVGQITIETKNTVFDEEYCVDHAGFSPGKYVMLGVSDNGSGIAPEFLDKIFEPFFTTKSLHKGTGLGLSTVHGIVKQNNGFIHIDSEVKIGTTIRIYLPRYTGQKEMTTLHDARNFPLSKGEIILLVEDEESLLKLAKQMLDSLGYTVLAAATPSKAVKIFEENRGKINLLITDVIMPGMNGRVLSEQLQNQDPDLKTLYMSGYTADVIAQQGVLEEGIYFLAKPLSKKELSFKVREALGDSTE